MCYKETKKQSESFRKSIAIDTSSIPRDYIYGSVFYLVTLFKNQAFEICFLMNKDF